MSDWPLLWLISKSRRSCLKWAQVELNCSICQGATIQSWSFSEKWQKLILTGVTQLLELDQENSIYSIYFCNIVLILYRYEKICIKMYLLVEFSSFSSLQFTIFVFQFTIWRKKKFQPENEHQLWKSAVPKGIELLYPDWSHLKE